MKKHIVVGFLASVLCLMSAQAQEGNTFTHPWAGKRVALF